MKFPNRFREMLVSEGSNAASKKDEHVVHTDVCVHIHTYMIGTDTHSKVQVQTLLPIAKSNVKQQGRKHTPHHTPHHTFFFHAAQPHFLALTFPVVPSPHSKFRHLRFIHDRLETEAYIYLCSPHSSINRFSKTQSKNVSTTSPPHRQSYDEPIHTRLHR